MSFELTNFTQDIQAVFRFAEITSETFAREWLGRRVLIDRVNSLAILPHDFSHADYPDRVFTFLFDGECASANQWIGAIEDESRITITFEAHMATERCHQLAALFEKGIQLIKAPYLPLPVVWVKRPVVDEIKQPRTMKRVIEKLNQFCEALNLMNASTLADLEEVIIQSVITTTLMPKELETLRKHLTIHGWSELTPAAQNLMRKVLERIDQP
jgi:hypothetical protein